MRRQARSLNLVQTGAHLRVLEPAINTGDQMGQIGKMVLTAPGLNAGHRPARTCAILDKSLRLDN
jgi:hypothetical protein